MAARRIERLLLVLATVLAVVLVGLVVSGVYLKWFYRPTEALEWTDIRTLRHDVTVGRAARGVHRSFSWLFTVALPGYAVTYTIAGTPRTVAVRRRHWIAALTALTALSVAVIGPSIVVWTFRIDTPLLRWRLLHEFPAYLLLAAVAYAMVVRPRRAEPPSESATPQQLEAVADQPAGDAQRQALPGGDPTSEC